MIKKNNAVAILCLGIILLSRSLFVGHLLSKNADAEAQEDSLNLSKYIMVDGYGGGWVYEARIVDAVDPILTLLVLENFSQ